MGYDMRFHDGTPGDDGYFRLNIWGMRIFREYMADRGMAFDAGDYPAWPEAADFGITTEQLYAVEYPEDYPGITLTDSQREAAKRFRAAQDAVLAWHGPERPGIPVHKFGSNDGWIVLPAECEAAYRIGKDKPAPDGDDAEYWAKWLDYLRRAASHGGFEVH